jgi:hypothetical protein
MGAAAILLPRATPPPSCHGEVPHHIAGVFAIVNLITTVRGFAGFPARPSILPSALRKSIIARGFGPGAASKNSYRVFPGRLETGEAATLGRRKNLYSKSVIFYQKSILYADFCIRETLGQIPLPVRCRAAFWWPDYRCRMVRQNALKQLISHGSLMLTEQFLGPESDSSAVDRGIAARVRLGRRTRSYGGWIRSLGDFGAAKPERIWVRPVRDRLMDVVSTRRG